MKPTSHFLQTCRSLLLFVALFSGSAGAQTPQATDENTMVSDGSGESTLRSVVGTPVEAATVELLHGAWRVDFMAAIAENDTGMSPEELAMMRALMNSMEITFMFHPDGSANMAARGMGQEEFKDGNWEVVSISGTALTFTLAEYNDDGVLQPSETFTATFVDSSNILFTKEGEAETMPLVRIGTPDIGSSPVAADPPPAAGPPNTRTPPAVPVAGMPVNHATAEMLVGAWSGDIQQMIANMGGSMTPQEQEIMQVLMSSMEMVFELRSDRSCSLTITMLDETDVKSGTWEVNSSDGNVITFTVTPTRGESFSDDPNASSGPVTFVATFVDSHNIELLRVEEDQMIPFFRLD